MKPFVAADGCDALSTRGRLPNFFLIGAAKCGTTSLWEYLRLHPDVFMSAVKEPSYFLYPMGEQHRTEPAQDRRHHTSDLASYRALFAHVGTEQAVGEASAEYFAAPAVPARLRAAVPHARVVVLLRDPVDRAYSAFLHQRREGREPASDFRAAFAALLAGDDRQHWSGGYRYLEASRYYPALCRWLGQFPGDQVRVYLTDDLRADPVAVCQDVFAFLHVDDRFRPDAERRFNTGGLPRSRWLHERLSVPGPASRWLAKRALPSRTRHRVHEHLQRANLRPPPSLERQTRAWLLPYFLEDINRVEKLLGRDLSAWRAP